MYLYSMRKSPADSSIRLEQRSHKPQVLGSSPSQPTIYCVNMQHRVIHTNTPPGESKRRCYDSGRNRNYDSCHGRAFGNGRAGKVCRPNAGNRRCFGCSRRARSIRHQRRFLSPSSSAGQSNGLLSRGSEVRILSGVPLTVPKGRLK